METQARYILVGMLVLLTLAAGAWFILWLGSAQREYDTYRIVFEEQVSGLSDGGAVRFNGIQVGEVASLDFTEDGLVEAVVRVDKKTPVKTDTEVKLELVGFTGLAVIQFEGGSASADLLKNTVNGTPMIKAQPSNVGLLLEGGEDIVDAINTVLSADNVNNISSIIRNIDTLTGTFADSSDDISLFLGNAAQLSGDLAKASDDLDRLLLDLDALATNEGKDALANVEMVAEEARLLVATLKEISQENRQNIKAFTGTGLQQVGPGLTEMRRLVRTAENFLKQLERDPRGYLLGEPVPEYKGDNE
ncbi:MAG: MlaD family protein [Pseudomonadota bacterium]